MFRKLIYLLCIVAVCNTAFGQKGIVLVNNGKSNYKIVIPADANDIEKQSAAVLQDYIQKISDCKIPVAQQSYSTSAQQIIIGRNKIISQRDTVGLGQDGFIIKKVNNSLIFTGGNKRGVLYSIYTFLEDYLGCRMYTATVTEVPHKSVITLPVSIYQKQTPAFLYRTTLFFDALNNTYCDFHKMHYFLEGWGLWVHSFDVLLPAKKYFQSHPEYFALINGKRNPAQLCLTNPEVLRLVTQNLQQKINKNPTAPFWSVSQSDGNFFCQCENCKRLDDQQESHQGSLLTFVNNVANHFPDKLITNLAYLYSEAPPKTLKPLPNVMIMLCTSDEERRVPLSKQQNTPFKEHFDKWSKITSQLFLWDYIVQFTNSLSPFPNLHTLQPNIQYFASKNVTYMFEQGIGDIPAEFSELRCYMASRLMWNINVNINATMQEFINGYYGKNGGSYINQYITMVTKNAAAKNALLRSGWSPVNNMNTYLTPDNIKAYKNIFNNALNATAGTVYNARIMKEYLPVLYAELEINKSPLAAAKTSLAGKQANTDLLNDFYKRMKQLNIVYLSEARMNVDDYYKSYNQLLGNAKQ